jgi:hypothetical protein
MLADLGARFIALLFVGCLLVFILPIALKLLFSMGVVGIVIAVVGIVVLASYSL